MEKLIKTLLGLLLRVLLLMMGLVFLASVLVVAVVLLGVWALRALWARLTGRPVQPLVFTMLRRAQWERFYRPGAARPADGGDVIDVESRQIPTDPQDRRDR